MTNGEKLDMIVSYLEKNKAKLIALESGMEEVRTMLQKYETNSEKNEMKFDTMERDIKNINIILEEEIRVNIKLIAEGHFNISRKIYEIIKSYNEVEMLAIRVGMLESDVYELKRKIS